MKLIRIVLVSILIMVIGAPTYSDQANSAFKNGARAESHTQYDAAYEAYGQAIRLKPKDPKYMVAYARVRLLAATEDASGPPQIAGSTCGISARG